ncbi:MAG TPA: hypothetical protein VKV27_15785 [Solirubrobacteraceae bacterium]|nr:hypothetical protein [Solirubrobacteraceae bacterium]
MRVRFSALVLGLAAACAVAAGPAGAAPVRDRGLTIHVVPRRILAGETVLIYGRLFGPDRAGQEIRLYHRIAPAPFFSLVSTTRTDALGFYEFVRGDGVVLTNRSWFVRGPGFTHSATVSERVEALVNLTASQASGVTRHPLMFTGSVTPGHAGDPILLQRQRGSSDDWQTIARARIGAGSTFSIPYAWRVPGAYELRALMPSDARNVTSVSDAVAVVIQQAEVPSFTIQTSAPIVAAGQAVTISGTLYEPGTTTPEPGVMVGLFAKRPGSGAFRELSTATTAQDGSYSFAGVASQTNELYSVRTLSRPLRSTAVLFEGAQDVLTLQASATTSQVGGVVAFSGTVSPDHAGHSIYLQRLGSDGDWHTVEVGRVTRLSTFSFRWRFGTPGAKTFRARITGGPVNVGGASAPVTVDVTLPPVSSLPTG